MSTSSLPAEVLAALESTPLAFADLCERLGVARPEGWDAATNPMIDAPIGRLAATVVGLHRLGRVIGEWRDGRVVLRCATMPERIAASRTRFSLSEGASTNWSRASASRRRRSSACRRCHGEGYVDNARGCPRYDQTCAECGGTGR